MTVVLDSRKDFTLENLRRVSVTGESVLISPGAKKAIKRSRQSFMAYLDSDRTQFIYGTTSEAGQGASKRISPEQQRQLARSRSRVRPGGGFGLEYVPERVVRMIIFARLANYIEGNAKARPIEAQRIASMLDRPLPKLPLSGQVGAGEILPLAHVMNFLPEGETEEGEWMARINGSPVSSALLCDVALTARGHLSLATQIFALSVDAYAAPLTPYSASLVRYARNPHEKRALRNLRWWFKTSSHHGRIAHQAPVSWRILPAVLGAVEEAVAIAEETASISLSSVTDNPVYILPTQSEPLGRAISTGGYHNAQAAPAIDDINARFADLCTLADRHTMKLHSADHLPANLADPKGDGWGTGLLSFLQVGYGEEARHAARRSFLPPSEGGGIAGQNDVASPSMFAYQKHTRARFCLDASLALLASSASQAFWVTNRKPSARLVPILECVRDYVPPLTSTVGRDMGNELHALQQYFQALSLSN